MTATTQTVPREEAPTLPPPIAANVAAAAPPAPRGPHRRASALVAALLLVVAFLGGWLVRDRAQQVPALGSIDVGFLRDMSDHHDQAVQLALIELANGESEVLKGFALDVVASQRFEIGLMEARLRDWGHGRGDLPREAMAWMGHPVPMDEMPGMATREQLAAFATASGREADGLFISLMTEHHRGGLHMAEHAWRHAENEQVRDLAERITKLQRLEIRELELARDRMELPR